MNRSQVLRAWGRILSGYQPFLSIEITRECPLRCPGCYAYEPAHLGGATTLRELSDYRGKELVERVLEMVEREKPMHVSIVGGDPLVRYRELDELLPQLAERGTHIQLVTSAFRPIPLEWATIPNLDIVVSVDGLQPEHDARRKPATYERILKHIAGHRVIIHCTVTAQLLRERDYLERFLRHWQGVDSAARAWISIFTPQRGATGEEILSREQVEFVARELARLRPLYSKLDMRLETIEQFLDPPQSPEECIFARSTRVVSADLKTTVHPCQFGGDPDCSRCGCIASMGLADLGSRKLFDFVELGSLFKASEKIGKLVAGVRATTSPEARA
ncbi:MAG TPA: radical SAM protein [Candidatus Acidoferrales bacterium]|nr:radical SAM protein [Candidatus Acidoferrales bacterium]